MGSYIETNDTLQITREQGFPKELDYERHKIKPYLAEDFKNKIIYINTLEEMKCAHNIIDRNKDTYYI